jgi:hypothetical protein
MLFPYTLFPAGNELILKQTKNTSSGWKPFVHSKEELFPSTSCLAGDKLVPKQTKNTATGYLTSHYLVFTVNIHVFISTQLQFVMASNIGT